MKKLILLIVLCGMMIRGANAAALLKPTGGESQALKAKNLDIAVDLRGQFAQTTVTTIYANPNRWQIEADFTYSAPSGAVVTGFAYWYRAEKVVARVVEKARAAQIYQAITVRNRDPALIEMIGKNTFRARIFPVEANQDLKIEIQLAQTLPSTKYGVLFSWPMLEETQYGALENFSFSIRDPQKRALSNNYGLLWNTENGAFVARQKKQNFEAKADLKIIAMPNEENTPALRAALFAAKAGGSDGFFALALTPQKTVAKPKIQISGVKTYEVLAENAKSLKAGQAFTVFGRYRGNGGATVSLNGLKTAVVFPNARENDNVAAKLWAARKIEVLSQNEKQKTAVMELSKRFSLPSKWTSWLAIPEEERRNFKTRMMAVDRDVAAQNYAQALARGDRKIAAQEKKRVAQLTKKVDALEGDPDGAQNRTAEILRQGLAQELENMRTARLQASYQKDKSQVAQLRRWIANLQRAGADDGSEEGEVPGYLLEAEFTLASQLLVDEIELGRPNSARARGLKKRLKILTTRTDLKRNGMTLDSSVQNVAQSRAYELAREFVWIQASSRPDRARLAHLQKRIDRLENLADVDVRAELRSAAQEIWGRRAHETAEKWMKSRLENGADAAPTQTLEAEVKRTTKLASANEAQVKQAGAVRFYVEYANQLAAQVAKSQENTADGQTLREKIAQIKAAAPGVENFYGDGFYGVSGTRSLEMAWRGRAHETAYKLEQAKQKSPNSAQIPALENDLKRLAKATGKSPKEFREWEKMRLAQNQPLVTAEEYRMRPGDPLISVKAPADCQQIVAILPSGEIKKLAFNAQTGQWEARFDIPQYAAEGSYFITIIVVAKNGQRNQLKMTFHVDTTAPQGKGELAKNGANWHLELQTDVFTDRVEALLPWGARMDLKRGQNGVFSAQIEAPVGAEGEVTYVLTDKAHNRTVVTVSE